LTLSVTPLVCTYSGVSVRPEPETQAYLVIRLLYEALQLHAQFSHYPQSCNLCHPGKTFDYLSRHKAVVQSWSILCGAHGGMVAAGHKLWFMCFNASTV